MSSPKLRPELDYPAYLAEYKVRGYNGKVNIFQAVSVKDAATILRRVAPEWSKEDHLRLAAQHSRAALELRDEWSKLADEAAVATFGRPFRFTDYRISGIACEEFSAYYKERLRFAAHASSNHGCASRAHAEAARRQ